VAVDEGGEVLVWVGNREENKGERIKEKGIIGESEDGKEDKSLEGVMHC
jgi:hypothetical protein